ncbi:serine/threonine-protein kinase ZRK4-like [Brassica napus]|uniref:serine/threonine-protein kinase ZRK4-like n=1 Tax=Brassica napus TaxID=3708 RepID=UPI002078F2B2|nr:serine/threonine-protein kinase ZRK4-like [Brassica napus]
MSWKTLITCCSRTTSNKSSLKNGGLLVEKLIRVSNGDYNPFFIFTEQELKQATKDYDQDLVCLVDDNYKLFRVLENRGAVLIKKTNEHEELVEYCIREIAVAAYVSSNMNLVKLLGCCLESKKGVIPWRQRIRIAAQVADAIAYLHLEVPEGETSVQALVEGTIGFLASESVVTERFNEQTDVFAFGATLIEILTGREPHNVFIGASDYMTNPDTTPVAESSLISVSSPKRIDLLMFLKANLIRDGKDNALEASAELAASCVEILPEKRPTIEEVAKKLKHIQNM